MRRYLSWKASTVICSLRKIPSGSCRGPTPWVGHHWLCNAEWFSFLHFIEIKDLDFSEWDYILLLAVNSQFNAFSRRIIIALMRIFQTPLLLEPRQKGCFQKAVLFIRSLEITGSVSVSNTEQTNLKLQDGLCITVCTWGGAKRVIKTIFYRSHWESASFWCLGTPCFSHPFMPLHLFPSGWVWPYLFTH